MSISNVWIKRCLRSILLTERPQEIRSQLIREVQILTASVYVSRFHIRRMDIDELKDKGIYVSKQMAAQQSLQKAMLSDQLNQSLRNRPFVYVKFSFFFSCIFSLFLLRFVAESTVRWRRSRAEPHSYPVTIEGKNMPHSVASIPLHTHSYIWTVMPRSGCTFQSKNLLMLHTMAQISVVERFLQRIASEKKSASYRGIAHSLYGIYVPKNRMKNGTSNTSRFHTVSTLSISARLTPLFLAHLQCRTNQGKSHGPRRARGLGLERRLPESTGPGSRDYAL